MSSNRQLRAGELIKRALVDIFNKGKSLEGVLVDTPVTISEVRVSVDLKVATIFILPFGGKVSSQDLLKALKDQSWIIRSMVTKRIQLKYSPDIIFRLDESFDNVAKIETLLKSI
jgi:ribosome-binding factor A